MTTHPHHAVHDGDALAEFVDKRDEAAFAALVTRHQALVHGVCRRIIGDTHDADDASQAVFLVLAMKAGKLRDSACVAGWLHRVSRHVALRARSANERRHRRIAPLSGDPVAPVATDLELDAALDALGETYRAPMLLHYVEGLSCEQIGERLAISPDAAAMRLSRGRDRLRRRLSASVFALLAAGATTGCSSDPASLAALAARVVSGIDGAGSHAVSALAHQASRALAWAPAKLAAGWTVALLTLGSAVTVMAQTTEPAPPPAPEVAHAPMVEMTSEWTDDGLVERVLPAGQLRVERLLRQPISLDVEGVPLEEALRQVAVSTGVSITQMGSAGSRYPVTLRVHDMRARHALDFIARLTGSDYTTAEDGVHWGEARIEPTLRFHLERVADRQADVPELAGLVVEACEAYRQAHGGEAADESSAWHHLDGEVLEVTGLQRFAARELLLDLRDPDRTKPSGAELDWRNLRRERHAWKFTDADLSDVVQKVKREAGMDLIFSPGDAANGPASLTYGSPDATNEELACAIAEAMNLHVSAVAEERTIFMRDGIAEDHPRKVGYHFSKDPLDVSRYVRCYAYLPYAGVLAARLRSIDPGLDVKAWNGELIVRLELPDLAALEALVAQLGATPQGDRAAKIAAFTLTPDVAPSER